MNLKTKIIRAKIKLFFTRSRYAGSKPRVKNAILIGFLLIVNSYVYFHVVAEYAKSPLINISFAKTIVYENPRWGTGSETKSEQPKEAHMDEANHSDIAIADYGTLAGIEAVVRETFGKDGDKMVKIMRCESQGNHKAIGDTKIAYIKDGIVYGMSYGLFQVRHLEGRPDPAKLFDPKHNIETAKKIYDTQGLNAWRNCNEMTKNGSSETSFGKRIIL